MASDDTSGGGNSQAPGPVETNEPKPPPADKSWIEMDAIRTGSRPEQKRR